MQRATAGRRRVRGLLAAPRQRLDEEKHRDPREGGVSHLRQSPPPFRPARGERRPRFRRQVVEEDRRVAEYGSRPGSKDEDAEAREEDERGARHDPGGGQTAELRRPQHESGETTRERGGAPFRPAESRQPHGRARRELMERRARASDQSDGEEPERRRMPHPDAHSDDDSAGKRHEDEQRDRDDHPGGRVPSIRDGPQGEIESGEHSRAAHRARERQRPEARAEDAEEGRVEAWSHGAEPVDDVAVEEGAAGESVRHDPLAPRVDERVGPLSSGDYEQDDRRGRGKQSGRKENEAIGGWAPIRYRDMVTGG